jgi:hypothetical protein
MTERTEDLGTYEMLWDCPYCGSEKLLGLTQRHCPGCGSAQDPERRYFPSDEDKVTVEDHRFVGADQVCPSCDTPNGAEAEFCGNCGTPLSDAAAAKTRKDIEHEVGADVTDSAKAARDEFRGGKAPPPPPEPPKKKGGAGKFVVILGLLAVALCVCGGVLTFWKEDVSLTVAGHSWERTIEVEKYDLVSDSDWKEDVPKGAKDVSCKKEKRSTKKVKDGETCKTVKKDQGDGSFKEVKECKPKYKEEPVYDQKCNYKIEKWSKANKEKASGKTKSGVKWPKVKSGGSGRGASREGKRTESYTVNLKESGSKVHECNMDQKRWAKLDKGDKVKGRKSKLTGGLDCGSVK